MQRLHYGPVIVVISAVFFLGVCLIVLSHFIAVNEPFPWAAIVRDVGIVLAPIAIISMIYEVIIRQEVVEHMRELARGFALVDLIFPESRHAKLDDIIDEARDNLIILGVTPLLEFVGQEQRLISRLNGLRSVKIAYLASTSPYIETRAIQSFGVDIKV
jgi:hypothetical protein